MYKTGKIPKDNNNNTSNQSSKKSVDKNGTQCR